jgi:hypothetical protein
MNAALLNHYHRVTLNNAFVWEISIMDCRTTTFAFVIALITLMFVFPAASVAGGFGGAVKSITKEFNDASGYRLTRTFNDSASRGYYPPNSGNYGTPNATLNHPGGPSTNAPSTVFNGLPGSGGGLSQ